MVANRKQVEQLIYDFYDALDPSGSNTDKMKSIFSPMNDKEFEKYMKEFLADDNENFIVDIVDFEHDVKFEYAEKAAKVIGTELFEYVYLPHLNRNKTTPIRTKEKCLVGYFNTKRTQQFLHKKNALSNSNEHINVLTGQVSRDDKNARDSDIEASMLISIGADKILEEFHGFRADDHVMKRQARQSISTKGYIMLDELENNPVNKVTLNSVSVYLLSMGIKNDLVTSSYILPKTTEEMFG